MDKHSLLASLLLIYSKSIEQTLIEIIAMILFA